MRFEGEFRVPGRPEDVIHSFADVERMASCFPGAVLDKQDEDGAWHGGLLVTFGPKKIKFKGKVLVHTDFENRTGTVNGRGAADMRAARVEVKLKYTLLAAPGAATPETIVSLVSDAELTGVLADFARTGGQAFAKVLMEEFSRRAQVEFSKDLPPADAAPTEASAPVAMASAPPKPAAAAQPAPAPVAISAWGLLWAVIKDKFAQWFGARNGSRNR